jgi:polar amino acid transport system substrate-binding protein
MVSSTFAESGESTVKLATGESYKPAIDFQKQGGGPLVENVRKVFQDMGLIPKIEPMPWKRAYLETQRTTYLASFPWYKDDEREKDFYFSDPLYLKPTVAVLRKALNIPRLNADTVSQRITCDILGSTIWNKLKATARVKLVYVNDPAQCQQMLRNGRIDFMMMHPEQADEYAQRGHKVIDDDLELSFNGHLIISKQEPHGEDIIRRFNQSMKKLMEQNSWQPMFAVPAK